MFRLYKHVGPLFFSLCVINISVGAVFGFNSGLTAYLNGSGSPLYTLITTHFSHHSLSHLISNSVALGLLLILFPVKPNILIRAFILCVVFVAGYVMWFEIEAFLGFSALLYCIPGCYLSRCVKNRNNKEIFSILMILYSYLFIVVPMNSENEQTWLPMTHAHLLGFLSGFVVQALRLNHYRSKLSGNQL